MKHSHTIVTLTYSTPPRNQTLAIYMKVKNRVNFFSKSDPYYEFLRFKIIYLVTTYKSYVACLSLPYFLTLFHIRSYKKTFITHQMSVLIFSTTLKYFSF